MTIDVTAVRKLGGYRLEITFSDGTIGVHNFGAIVERTGPMIEPLKHPVYFARVFVEDGALTWPNGYDWDPDALHEEMRTADELRQLSAAG